MRYALPGSALVHAGIFGIALVGFTWPQPEDAPAPGTVTVDIVSLSSVSSNETSIIESSATEDLVSAGAEAMPPSETLEPIDPDTAPPTEPVEQPVEPELVAPIDALPDQPPPLETTMAEPLAAEPVESVAEALEPIESTTETPEPIAETMEVAILSTPLDASSPETVAPLSPPGEVPEEPELTVAPLSAEAIERVSPTNEAADEPDRAVASVTTETIEPEMVTDFKAAPVPHTLSFERPSTPTQRPQQQRPQRPQQPRQASKPAPPPSQAGNGGQSNADAAAARATAGQQGSQGGGGSADIASWERQLRRALANALRYPRAANGAKGDVVVRFTVSAAGGLSGVAVLRSSGNPILDQAAIDTVARAAPFPPIPPGSGLASRTVDLPLAFVRN